jgi:hypothetical protein
MDVAAWVQHPIGVARLGRRDARRLQNAMTEARLFLGAGRRYAAAR